MTIEVVEEDCGDGSMLCTNHPYKNNTPGGICAFCLQEKLGKLVSSSFPITIFPSSSSPSPSFRSHHNFTTTSTTTTYTNPSSALSNTQNDRHRHNFNISKIPNFFTHKKKKKDSSSENHNNNAMIFKRSKSVVTPRKGVHFNEYEDFSAHKKRFFSFRHFNKQLVGKKVPEIKQITYLSSSHSTNMGLSSTSRERSLKKENVVVVEENETPDQVSFDRKVSRSRSVGCGSRSFSGDFFERISTGFGDCSTLRRVESHREGKSRPRRSSGAVAGNQNSIKERVKCGGLFSGFMLTSSSSSSSSSSYWVSSSNEDNNNNVNVKAPMAGDAVVKVVHGRSKSWGWAFASPMRAFSKPTAKRDGTKNVGPNLGAIPSLLAARS
ncbi:Myristoylated alanine-rich C-kinase [Heracleum sosnowskyi]|uniref:Myristoylated alanine-rich C-kinase n=1 Tax=Heracleum sosnowskyi TaxID=360622 RepID=A0AAD8ISV8_9APIA|nr:Myristoylated alanine-rich C-kinase [Heracleum sosnowskyi]